MKLYQFVCESIDVIDTYLHTFEIESNIYSCAYCVKFYLLTFVCVRIVNGLKINWQVLSTVHDEHGKLYHKTRCNECAYNENCNSSTAFSFSH